jgi:DNA-binding SARP family transcriptional activator
MRAHIASGNTAAALAVYKQLWDYLEQTFDIEPSPVTQALLVSIRSGECSPRMVPFEQPALNFGPADEEFGQAIFLAMRIAAAWLSERKQQLLGTT